MRSLAALPVIVRILMVPGVVLIAARSAVAASIQRMEWVAPLRAIPALPPIATRLTLPPGAKNQPIQPDCYQCDQRDSAQAQHHAQNGADDLFQEQNSSREHSADGADQSLRASAQEQGKDPTYHQKGQCRRSSVHASFLFSSPCKVQFYIVGT